MIYQCFVWSASCELLSLQQTAMSQTVWLGLAGDLVADDTCNDLYATRVGGRPLYPGQKPPAAAESNLTCSVCGSQLSLVLQAYAPHPDVPHRVILLFGCVKLGCGKAAGCWKALRCQLQQQQDQNDVAAASDTSVYAVNQKQPKQQQQQQQQQQTTADAFSAAGHWGDGGWGAAAPPPAAAADPWSTAAASDFDVCEPAVVALSSCNLFDFSDLTSSLEAASQQAAAAKQRGREFAADSAAGMQQADTESAAAAAVCCRGTCGPTLPEFYLYAEAEPDAKTNSISSKDIQHVQQLLSDYEAQESAAATAAGGTTSSSSSTHPADSSSSVHHGEIQGSSSEEGATWAGESYEKDEVRGVERGYLKFSKRVARRPEQCVRYCLGGQLLWPKAQPPQPSPCPRCGGPRVFELQLMPALIQMIIEAAQMMLEQEMAVNLQVIDAVANWDWCTVAVFTCEASCSGSQQGASTKGVMLEAVFEEVSIINEQDCHIALPAPVPGICKDTPASITDADDEGHEKISTSRQS